MAVREDRDKHTEHLGQQILQVAHAAVVKDSARPAAGICNPPVPADSSFAQQRRLLFLSLGVDRTIPKCTRSLLTLY